VNYEYSEMNDMLRVAILCGMVEVNDPLNKIRADGFSMSLAANLREAGAIICEWSHQVDDDIGMSYGAMRGYNFLGQQNMPGTDYVQVQKTKVKKVYTAFGLTNDSAEWLVCTPRLVIDANFHSLFATNPTYIIDRSWAVYPEYKNVFGSIYKDFPMDTIEPTQGTYNIFGALSNQENYMFISKQSEDGHTKFSDWFSIKPQLLDLFGIALQNRYFRYLEEGTIVTVPLWKPLILDTSQNWVGTLLGTIGNLDQRAVQFNIRLFSFDYNLCLKYGSVYQNPVKIICTSAAVNTFNNKSVSNFIAFEAVDMPNVVFTVPVFTSRPKALANFLQIKSGEEK